MSMWTIMHSRLKDKAQVYKFSTISPLMGCRPLQKWDFGFNPYMQVLNMPSKEVYNI